MGTKHPSVDTYIEKAEPFARPILKRIRTIVHKACPKCEETIKWSFPHFEYRGPLCSMAAFKGHCMLGFSKAPLLKDAEQFLQKSDRTAMGNLGRISSLADLPSAAALAALVKQAATLNVEGVKVPRSITRKPPLRVPPWFTAALAESPKAKATFDTFPPSHKREYVEWLTEAKSEATRARRLATALEWIAQGKSRNWKYQPKR